MDIHIASLTGGVRLSGHDVVCIRDNIYRERLIPQ